MLRVLLVDDEPLSMIGLQSVVDWEKLGYEICGACENGEEAVALTKKLRPDVIVTDMKMPVMDGLTLISHITNKVDKNIKFIILSGYSEFEYAKKALQLGVKYYVLKPLFEEEMTAVLKEVCHEIEENRKTSVVSLEELYMSLGCAIGRLVHGECSMAEFLKLCEMALNSVFNQSSVRVWYYILVKTLEDGEESDECHGDKADCPEPQVRKRSIGNILGELAKKHHPIMIVNHNKSYHGLFAGFPDSKAGQGEIEVFVDTLLGYLEEYCSQRFYIAVGMPICDLKHIMDSYDAALKALSHSFYEKPNSIIFYDAVKERILNYTFLQNEFINQVINAIEETDPSKVESIIETAFLYFKKMLLAREIVHMYVKNIVYRSIKLIRNLNGNTEMLLQGFNPGILEKCNPSIVELKQILTDYCMECCKILSERYKNKVDESFHRIDEYIRQNYKKPITIKEMSKSLYINPVYLGQLFKRKFGIRFNEYIHKLRIEEAKRLLKEDSKRMYEISQEVGYSNYHIFLQHFEKNTGTKPKNYQKA